MTDAGRPVEDQVARALGGQAYDVVVVGTGLRTLPLMADEFERIINMLHEQAPHAKLASSSQPDVAALRWL